MLLIREIVGRFLLALILIASVAALNFLLLHAAPGDIVETIVGEMGGATEETVRELRHQFGLDRPFVEQFFLYIGRTLTGDLGISAYYNRPVAGLILDRVPATVLLVFTSLAIALVLGVILGVISARFSRSWFAAVVNVVALLGFSAPVFWSGLLLLLMFAIIVPLVPTSGMYDVAAGLSGWAFALDVLHHLILPATTLALIYLALYTRLTRASMLEVMNSDYIRTARAKGLHEGKVLFKHGLRNALMPVVTMAGLQLSGMLAGAVLVETVFTWPGLGLLAYDAISRRDNQLILGILVASAVLVIVGTILTDLLYRLIDPRVGARS